MLNGHNRWSFGDRAAILDPNMIDDPNARLPPSAEAFFSHETENVGKETSVTFSSFNEFVLHNVMPVLFLS